MSESPLEGVEVREGQVEGRGLRVAILVSRFNGFVTERLLEGAVDTCKRSGVESGDITVYRTAGAWELPMLASKVAEKGNVDAIVAIGCLVRGETIHFEIIGYEAARGLVDVSNRFGLPVSFGVLTTETLEQAVERAGGKHGNKGGEAAAAALEQARVYATIG